jgi:integrase
MPKQLRIKTKYPGVYYLEGRGADRKPERIFYIQYRREGRLIEEKAGRQFQDDMTPARANALRADRIQGRTPSNQERRDEERAEKWILTRLWAEYKQVHLLKGLAQDESRFQTYLGPAFGNKEPKDLVPLDIDRLKRRQLMGKSPQTIKNVLALLRRIARFGQKRNLCAGLSFQIDMPKSINNIVTEDLSDEQLARLLEVLDEEPDIQTANMVRLCLCTGLRRSELLRLQWTHIDFEGRFIHLKAPKGGANQVIPLNESARKILERHPRTEPSPFVFPGREGKQKVDPRKALNRIKKKASLPGDFRPLHGLRHTFASHLASSGQVDLYTLQKLLTHKSPEMTLRYAHLRDEALRKASDLAGNLISKAKNGKSEKVVSLTDRE